MSSSVTGVRPLLRASGKQEARSFAPWIVIVTALSVTSIVIYPQVFPTEESRQQLAATVGSNPALTLIFGPANDLTTVDGFNTWRTLAIGGFLAGLMAIFAVVKASRGQEDSGQAELLASGVMGRSTRLTVAVGMALIASVVLGVVCALATGLSGGDWEAASLLSCTFAATGMMFAAVAALCAQLGSDARTASSLAVAALGAQFIVRGYFDSIEAEPWTDWLTPQGWMETTQPGIDNNWWPLLLALLFIVVVLAVSFVLQARRDFGLGLISPEPGPARGSMRTPGALTRRLNRGQLISWSITFTLLGVVFGSVASSLRDLLAGDPAIQGLIASGVTEEEIVGTFLVMILSLIGIIAAVGGVQTMLKVRSEELDDRVEPVMAAAVRRVRYYGANIAVAFAGPAVAVLLAGTVVSLVVSNSDLEISPGDLWLQALTVIPATWTVVALAVLVIGARPQVRVAAWAGVLLSFVLTIFGPTLGLDDWVLAISPFWHVPHVMSADVDWSGLGWITLFTVGFLTVGTVGFPRRDLART